MTLPNFSNRELRDALRVAVQSAAGAATTYMLMKLLDMPEKFVGVLSAALVISPGIGETLGGAWKRIVATIIGALLGGLCLWLLPSGYGTAIALGASLVVMSGFAGLFPQWQYGVVAAVALALGAEEELLQVSFDRTFAIGLGVIVGSILSLLLWPQKSSTRANQFIREALRDTSKFFKLAVDTADNASVDVANKELNSLNDHYTSMISKARSAANSVNLVSNDTLMDRISATEWLHNSLVTIRQIAENEDDIDSDNEQTAEILLDIESKVAEILLKLAEGGSELDETLIDNIHQQIQAFRANVSEDKSRDSWNHVNRATMVFALDQIAESIKKLAQHVDAEC